MANEPTQPTPETVVARAICARRCAAMGDKPCYDLPGEWPPDACYPSCTDLADQATNALREHEMMEDVK